MPADRSVSTSSQRRKRAEPSGPCTVCGKTLGRASDLKRHMDTHGPKTHICPEPNCNFASHTASGLKVHNDRHTKTYRKCPDCEFQCHDPSILHRHRKKKHQYVPREVAPKARKPTEYVPPCVPATVRRTISAQENRSYGTYSQFASFPSGSTSSAVSTPLPDTLSDLSELSEFTNSDTESSRSISPALSSSSSSSSDFDLPDISVIQRENAARAARRVQFMTSSPQYLTPDMLSELKAVSRTQDERCDAKVEFQNAFDQAYPQFPSYTVQSVPGNEVTGFQEFERQPCNSMIFPAIHSDDTDVSMLEGGFQIDPALLSLDQYMLGADGISDDAAWSKSYLLFEDEHTNENIYDMSSDAHVAGQYDGCYTNVVFEHGTPLPMEAEEDRHNSSPPAPFTSWMDFLHQPLTPVDEIIPDPSAD